MKRLMPLRDYDEHDVINMFALNTANTAISDSGNGDAGVIVKVLSGDMGYDPVELVTSSYLGKSDYPNVGRVNMGVVPLRVSAAGTGDAPMGITLYETAMEDENGQKLIYYKTKAFENQVVLTGQAVPVLTRGTVMLTEDAFVGSVPAPSTKLVVGSGSGKFDALGAGGAGTTVYGKVLATGQRVAQKTADYFVGAAGTTGTYALVQFDFNK